MRICVVGTGYVGLVSAACFAEMGNHVSCVDVNPKVVEGLKKGKVHIYEPGLEDLVLRNHDDGRLLFTTDIEEGLQGAEVAFICVGTPSSDDGSANLDYVLQAARDVGRFMQAPIVVADKSTVPVGTADKVRTAIAEELKKRGSDLSFDVVSNPEFLKEGDAVSDFMKPDRVIIGTESSKSADLFRLLYAPFARSRDKLIIMGTRSAEMTKYAANCMLATKISFINEMACISERVGADIGEVRTGISTDHRIGHHFIYPGVGYGGSCFPKDVKALIHTARQSGFIPELLESVDAVNDRQKAVMSRKIKDYFEPQGGVKGKTLALWGLAFKANTDDMREAASLVIINDLTAAGMKVRAFDPVAAENAVKILEGNPLFSTVGDQYSALDGADALLVVTEWNQFRTPDFKNARELLKAPVLFDGRNLYDPAAVAAQGFAYFSIGRAPK